MERYTTKAGSVKEINSGRVRVEFDWLEEENACCDCDPIPDNDTQYLHWRCLHCGGDSAELQNIA